MIHHCGRMIILPPLLPHNCVHSVHTHEICCINTEANNCSIVLGTARVQSPDICQSSDVVVEGTNLSNVLRPLVGWESCQWQAILIVLSGY